MSKLFVVGIGPGGPEQMSVQAVEALKESEIIVGYSGYIEYVKPLIEGKEIFQTGMTGEIERCKYAVSKVKEGKTVSIISTGDAGLYGMAGPILELAPDLNVEIVPGISAAFAAASRLGAPLMHDTALISLSDRLTDYEIIKKRLELAAEGDFVIALYNPKSKTRTRYIEEAVNIILKFRSPKTPAGIAKNACRNNEEVIVTELQKIDYEKIDMFTLIIIGNSNTYIQNGKMITPRGYEIK
ncbi:precorrin-3B C(17)-methyltransferase [Treponema sp. OMZ 792]|uniref:precorrin-3B C(17)-methyltransferase n=1 Tax=unclassified Treponema TaxID=2638727 RepID=UPI0020A4C4DD|nr:MULTISPECIES: precorrin-3B C(17)-methyltransferase [unclassified Treponema]UTC74657.1 precorrin-3B C(17)-methyltransferase [Treponema sp. OMZ 792]UTC81053.1 precorrin-3B C(17)-methyltransferase [Treponema sp. OMZ 798]